MVLISHWFDGLAHLHRFDIVASDDADKNRVSVFYSSRRQCNDFVKYVQEKGSFGETISFGQKADPCVGIFGKMMSCFKALDQSRNAKRYDNLNVTVYPAIHVPGLVSPVPGPLDGQAKVSNGTVHTSGPTTSAGHRNDTTRNLWIASDTSGLRAIDGTTLQPLGPTTIQNALHPSLKGGMSCAHAQRCPKTGDIFNYNLQAGPMAIYTIFRVSAATGKTDILATISRVDVPVAYIHSFFLSERFVVLRVPSAHFGKMGLVLPWKGNVMNAMDPFDERKKCKWFVIDRIFGRGVVGEFETPAAFFFHSVNCWDKVILPRDQNSGDEPQFAEVFCDVVDFPTMDILEKQYYDVLMNTNGQAQKWHADKVKTKNSISSLVRWEFRVPLPTEKHSGASNSAKTAVEPEVVFTIPSPHTGELPTINPSFHTRPYRYLYSLPQNGKSTFVDTIVKTDTVTREILQWNNAAGHTPSEAIFVPRPGSEDEDDGVLLSVVLDGHSEKSYLLCLNAKSMEELGKADMDFAVGFGFHGIHSPS